MATDINQSDLMWLPPIECYHQAAQRLPGPGTPQRAPLEHVQTAMARLRDDDLEMPRTRHTGSTHAIFDL